MSIRANFEWKALGVLCVILILGLGLALLGLRGRGLCGKIAYRIQMGTNLGKAMWGSHFVSSNGDLANIIFLHHSTGANLIRQGGVRERLAEAGYQFWDHGYNAEGLTRPDGTSAGYHYHIPNDNTDPDGFANIFSQRLYAWPRNALSGLMQHEVIIFKSCFPVSQIASDAQLERYKTYYLQMREVMDQHPDHIFIVVTPPPLNPAATDAEVAARARAFAEWLKSDEFLVGHSNVLTFDFFGLLAEEDPAVPDHNMLRAEYRDGTDSHPNALANKAIGPLFADFIVEAVEVYRAEVDAALE